MGFGLVLLETVDKDGKKTAEKMKTRSGDTIKLMELIDEGKSRALAMFKERQAQSMSKVQICEEEMEAAAEVLGVSSIKYFDLHMNRKQNYGFNFNKMLDPKGNTGVYLIYQYARMFSIIGKSKLADPANLEKARTEKSFKITHKAEMDLAMMILQLPEALSMTVADLAVNRLTDLLYEMSVKIGEFYNCDFCKVINSEHEESRVLLLDATRKIMKVCFDLLGMKTLEKI